MDISMDIHGKNVDMDMDMDMDMDGKFHIHGKPDFTQVLRLRIHDSWRPLIASTGSIVVTVVSVGRLFIVDLASQHRPEE